MTRKFSVLLISLVVAVTVRAQFDAQFSQYMFNNAAFNPASIGDGELIQMIGQGRFPMPGIGFKSAPTSFIFDINSPIKINQQPYGIGFRFLNDKIGLFQSNTFHLQFAYKKQFDESTLSIGCDLGYVNIAFLGDSLNSKSSNILDQDTYHIPASSDPAVPKQNINGGAFDATLGAYYKAKHYYAGLSWRHFNGTTVQWTNQLSFKQYGTSYLTAGYNYPIVDTKLTLKPSALFRTDFSSYQVEASCLLDLDSKFWGGLSYRYEDALIVILGLELPGGYTAGYSLDWSVRPINSWFFSEFFISYSFSYVLKTRNSRYKSIRLL